MYSSPPYRQKKLTTANYFSNLDQVRSRTFQVRYSQIQSFCVTINLLNSPKFNEDTTKLSNNEEAPAAFLVGTAYIFLFGFENLYGKETSK
jgi:hypothetical protein